MDILLKKEIELIEEITGKKFGPMPLVLPNNAQNRLLAYFLDQATTGDRFEALNAAKEYSKTEADGNGKYFPSAHIVLFPETGSRTCNCPFRKCNWWRGLGKRSNYSRCHESING